MNQRTTILAGDFNCVQKPFIDKIGGTRKGRPNISALQGSIEDNLLEDGFIFSAPVDGEGKDLTKLFFYVLGTRCGESHKSVI